MFCFIGYKKVFFLYFSNFLIFINNGLYFILTSFKVTHLPICWKCSSLYNLRQYNSFRRLLNANILLFLMKGGTIKLKWCPCTECLHLLLGTDTVVVRQNRRMGDLCAPIIHSIREGLMGGKGELHKAMLSFLTSIFAAYTGRKRQEKSILECFMHQHCTLQCKFNSKLEFQSFSTFLIRYWLQTECILKL